MMYVIVFLVVALTDVVWALYMAAVADRLAWRAALWSALIVLLGSFTVVQYIHNHRMLAAAVLGAFVGTYFTVRRSKP